MELQEFFQFNLLPKKTEKEVKVIKDRDESVVYSLILIFAAIFIYLLLNLIQMIFIDSKINQIKENITQVSSDINLFQEVRKFNGETFIKSILLKSPVNKDVKAAQLIEISDSSIETKGLIIGYKRLETGEFGVIVEVSDLNNVAPILDSLETKDEIEKIVINSIVKDPFSENTFILDIKFNIIKV